MPCPFETWRIRPVFHTGTRVISCRHGYSNRNGESKHRRLYLRTHDLISNMWYYKMMMFGLFMEYAISLIVWLLNIEIVFIKNYLNIMQSTSSLLFSFVETARSFFDIFILTRWFCFIFYIARVWLAFWHIFYSMMGITCTGLSLHAKEKIRSYEFANTFYRILSFFVFVLWIGTWIFVYAVKICAWLVVLNL